MAQIGAMSEKETERTRIGNRIVIYRRGKKRIYIADFHYNGKHCRQTLNTTVKKIAVNRGVQLEHSLAEGTFLSPRTVIKQPISNSSLPNIVKDFLLFGETEGRRKRTLVKQRGILNRFVDFAAESNVLLLSHVDLRLIDSYRASRQAELSPKSMHNEGQLLKQFFGWCEERALIGSNPLSKRKFRPPKCAAKVSPSVQQINRILKAVSETKYPVLATLAFTGARSGEIASLRVEDVDLKGNWLRFESRDGYETKTGDSRKIPIHSRLRPVLEKALARGKDGWLFTALPSRKYPNGDHYISTKHLNTDFVATLKKLGIPTGQANGFTVHSLRRSFKTICVNGGIPREVVDAWQGHARIRTASDLYYSLPDFDSQRFMKMVPFHEDTNNPKPSKE